MNYSVRSLYSHTNSCNVAITQCHVDGAQRAWATCAELGLKGPFTQAIFVAVKSHRVSNMFETPAISGRQIALKIVPGLHVRF